MKRRKPTPKQIRDSATRAAFRNHGWDAGLKHIYRETQILDLVYHGPLLATIRRGDLNA